MYGDFYTMLSCHCHFAVCSRPDGKYKSNTGNDGCKPDFLMIPGGSNFGTKSGCTAGPTAATATTIDRSVGIILSKQAHSSI